MDHGAEHSEAPLGSSPLGPTAGRGTSRDRTALSVVIHLDEQGHPLSWGWRHLDAMHDVDGIGAGPSGPFDTAADALLDAMTHYRLACGEQLELPF